MMTAVRNTQGQQALNTSRRIVSDGGHLKLEDLLRTRDAMMRSREPHAHLIAASATPGSMVMCAGCGAPVRVPEDWLR